MVDDEDKFGGTASSTSAAQQSGASGHEETSPQTNWEFGARQGKMVVEKLSKDKDRLRPIWVTGFEVANAMDAYGTFLVVFGSISLDYPTFKLMHKHYNKITKIPGTSTTKPSYHAIPMIGALVRCPSTLCPSIIPPYCGFQSFVSLRGRGINGSCKVTFAFIQRIRVQRNLCSKW